MKQIIFEALHNVVAHPLLTVCALLSFILVTAVSIIVIACIPFRKEGALKLPKWVEKIDPMLFAEWFHDYTAVKAYGQTH